MDKDMQERIMRQAMDEAEQAIREGNSPYGAVLIDAAGNVIASGHNTARSTCDPTAHAEMNVFREAGKKLQKITFDGCILFANSESCSMCMSASIKFHVYTFYFGARAGRHMDPYILPAHIIRETTSTISITTNILLDLCTEQITRGKQHLL